MNCIDVTLESDGISDIENPGNTLEATAIFKKSKETKNEDSERCFKLNKRTEGSTTNKWTGHLLVINTSVMFVSVKLNRLYQGIPPRAHKLINSEYAMKPTAEPILVLLSNL